MTPELPDRLDLWDFSGVGKKPWRPGDKGDAARSAYSEEACGEIVKFCKELQESINRDDSAIFRLNAGAEADSFDDEEGEKKTSVFKDSGTRVNKYAGILFFRGKTIVIHSRFDHSDKDYFLSYALRKLSVPSRSSDMFAPPAAAGKMEELLLPRVFLELLASACDVGLYRQYQTVLYNDSSPRGHIDIARHIRLNPMENGRIAYSSRVYTIDNPVNRVILAAYTALRGKYGGEMARLLQSDSRLSRPVQTLLEQLGGVDLSPASVRQLIHKADTPITHPMHRRYETLRRMSIMILRSEGLDFFSQADDLRASGVLIPMDRVWERLLESLFPEGTLTAQTKFDILGGRRQLKPDLLLPAAVFDAKYRLPWTQTYCDDMKGSAGKKSLAWTRSNIREDVFQVLSYMYVLGLSTGGVIFPYPGDASKAEPERVFIRRYSENLPENLRGEETFWLFPFPLPAKADSQAEFDQIMEKNSNGFVKWMEFFQ